MIQKRIAGKIGLILAFIFAGAVGKAMAAEDVVGLVRENCSGYSNCYTTLAAWETAFGGVSFGTCTVGNLVCAGKNAVAQIDGSWTNADTGGVVINGWTTGPDNYIRIHTAPAARHDGKWKTTAYRLQTTGTSLTVNEENVRLDGLQVYMADTTLATYRRGVLVTLGTSAADIRISNSIVRANGAIGSNSTGIAFEATGVNSKFYIWNSNVYGFKSDYVSGVRSVNANWTGYLYNVISAGNDYGFRNSGGTLIAKNTYGGGNTHSAYDGTFSLANAASSDGTGSAGLQNIAYSVSAGAAFNSITVGSEDFHIKAASLLKDSGVATSGEPAPLNFTTDIDGQARSAPWDIGSDDAGGSAPVDAAAPSVPAGLSAVPISASQINLSWNASTDNVGVTGYKVFRWGVQIATVTATSYANVGLSAATLYTFGVSAFDAVGNASAQAATSTQTLSSPDSTPPNLAIQSPVSGATVAGTVLVSGTAQDNIALTKLEVSVDSGSYSLASGTGSWNYSWNSTAFSYGSHSLSARATDSSGNARSQTILVTVNNAASQSGTDKKIHVQGKLTDASGNPVTGPKLITFRLYTTSTGPIASRIWEDSLGVNLANGLFNVTLGQSASIDAIAFDKPLYAGFQVAGDAAEMVPRQVLGSSAYALGSIGNFNAGRSVLVGDKVGIGTQAPTEKLQVEGNALINGTIRGASWGFGGSYSVDDCGTNTTVNPITGAASCPAGFTSYVVGKFKAGDSNCADRIYLCIR